MERQPEPLIALLRTIYGNDDLPEPFDLLALMHDEQLKKGIAEPAAPPSGDRRTAARAKKVATLLAAPDALEHAVGIAAGTPLPEKKIARAETVLGGLLLGTLAEQAFEHIYRTTLNTTELRLTDERASRNDTDYRVINGGGRQVFRMNIKLHGARFRKAQEAVGLDPSDCFPLATYKIWQGLQKQEKEILPYLWVVIDCDLPAVEIGKRIPRRFTDLIALVYTSDRIKGKRAIEERVVAHLIGTRDHELAVTVDDLRQRLASAPWRVISARRADTLLRKKLFDRVFAVRIPGFNRAYGGAELNMHFSLTDDMTPLQRFLAIIREKGVQGITAELERGTV
jgi:hypothetical protein